MIDVNESIAVIVPLQCHCEVVVIVEEAMGLNDVAYVPIVVLFVFHRPLNNGKDSTVLEVFYSGVNNCANTFFMNQVP
ncbi:hypothetical protein ECANGB1_432 [Enterospora canceri]|uniref:Uncharacterized protein n=1 Tax=Enterospora canceri TaxID=1081671 RepID=A0A1Y1S3K4_9MICR|nr:hypothetical protein ECANGB1_432 [Enterospora canceri]